jgi:nitrogen fixation protein NifB
MTPRQAAAHLEEVLRRRPETNSACISGPGDPFAHADVTLETLRLARARFPGLNLCVSTNGLNIAPSVDELAGFQVCHVAMTINAVDPAIGCKIHGWVRNGNNLFQGRAGAALLGARQIDALLRLKHAGIRVKINAIVLPGINDDHIPEIARKVAEFGADVFDIIPYTPTPGSVFEQLPEPDILTLVRLRLQCGHFLPLMNHHRQNAPEAHATVPSSPILNSDCAISA